MSLLRVSLRLLPLLALVAACTGKRADPEPSQNPPPSNTGGAGNGGSPSNGGAPSTGGMGGAPSTGGMGGTPGTGGAGGTPATGGAAGVGGNSGLNLAADIYPFCGCLDDAQDTAGACDNCVATAACATELANCPLATCGAIVSDLRMCAFNDLPCYDAAYISFPEFFDDAVALISCECGACGDPVCDGTACVP